MIFLFGMVSFVTNLAAPMGVVWKNQPGIEGSNFLGMMGNMMNFLAYLFMGIPAGKILNRNGYKKTALMAIAVGFVGVFVQYLSGIVGVGSTLFSLPANFFVYLLGAFISGFSVCMLNTVVNPMLTLLGGGGNKANQYIQIGGTFNSTLGMLTPMLVGALIGNVKEMKGIAVSSVNLVLYIAMAVFFVAFIVISFLKIEDPEQNDDDGTEAVSPWKYRHFVLGVIAIFFYVGVEVGTPGTLNFFISDEKGANLGEAIGGFCAGTYWFMMLVGRLVSSLVSGKVSGRVQLGVMATVAVLLLLGAIFLGTVSDVVIPVFNGSRFLMTEVPLAALLIILVGLCTSVMWGAIFNLAVEGLGKATAMASGIFMMMVVGGGILPLIQNAIADKTSFMTSYWLPLFGFAYLCWYAWSGSKIRKSNK